MVEYTLEIPNGKIFPITNLSVEEDNHLFFLWYADLEFLKGLKPGERVLLDNQLMSLDNACDYFGINVMPRSKSLIHVYSDKEEFLESILSLKEKGRKEPDPPYVIDLLDPVFSFGIRK